MKVRTWLSAILAIAILFISAVPTWSQTSVASLNGTVLDESGGTVAGASISLREMDRNTRNENEPDCDEADTLRPAHALASVSRQRPK